MWSLQNFLKKYRIFSFEFFMGFSKENFGAGENQKKSSKFSWDPNSKQHKICKIRGYISKWKIIDSLEKSADQIR